MGRHYWLINCIQMSKTGGFRFSQKNRKEMLPHLERVCFSCDHKYSGGIYCPSCGKPDGEILDWAGQDIRLNS